MKNIFNNKEVLEITGKILSKKKKEEALCNEVYFLNAQNGKFIIKMAHGDISKTKESVFIKEI